MAIDFSDVAKPIDEKQLPNQTQAGLVDFSDVAKPIGTNESRNANQWSPANGTIFDQIDQQKLMYDPNLPDATIGRVFMAGVKDAFEGYAGGSAMEAAESRNIMGMTPEQIKAHLGEGARNSLMGDYALAKMENIDNNYIKNKEGIKAGIRDVIVDKATALAKMADPGDYNLPTSFLGQLGHDILRSTPYSMMSAVPSIATGALTGGAALPTLIVSFLTSMGEASSEGGRTYISMIEAGKSHDEAYAAASKNKDFNTLMLTLSNMISGQLFGSVPRGIDEVNFAKLKGTPLSELSRAGQVMGKAMERPIISNIAKSPIKRGLVSLGSEFVMEGAEEMGQSVSDAVVRGEKINVPNLLYEGLVGGLSGAGQSSVGTAIDYAKNRGARAKYKKLAELMEIMKEKDTPEGGNNKVVAEAISKFKDNEHNVMFDALNERNRILALPLEDRSALEEQALPVLSEAVNLFAQGKVEEGLSLLAEKNVNFDFEEEQTFPTKPQGPVKDVSMHSNETISAIGEGPQLQEMARAEFNRLRSIPANQRTAKDNQDLQAYRRIMEGYTAGNNLAGDLGFVAQRTVAGQPITANEHTQQSAPIPGRSFNNAQLAPISERSPLDRTYVGEPRAVSGGFIINKPDGNAFFVPQAEMGGYYQVGNEQPQAQIPITPQPAQTQPIPKSKKQQKPAPVPQVRDGVGTNDIYQGGDGVAYWVRGFDANNKIVMADNTGSILRVTPEQLGQNFQRLSPARREQVSLSAPVRSEVPSLADQQKAAGKEQAAQQKQQTATTQKQAGRAAMPRTPEVAKAAAKARTEKQARPTTEKTNTSTPAQTTTEQEQMARGKTAQTPSESTTTNEVKKEDKVPKETKGAQESTVKVGEKYKNKTGQTVIVKSVEDGNVSYDLETPGIMKPSPRSIEKFTENYKKIDDNANYSLETKTDKGKKPTLTAKDISSSVKGAKVEQLETGIIRMQFKNGFVLHVDPDSDAIVVDPDIVQRDYGRKLKPGEMAVGKAAVIGKEGFIRLVAGMTDVKAFSHELYHIAEKMVLTDEQIAIVRKAYGGVENRANAFADVAFKRQQAKSKLLTSIFQKIADFFADIRASIFGERAEDIFRSVSEGKVWGQKLKDATRDESYKIANKAKSTTDKLSLDDPALTEHEKELLVKIDEYYNWEPSKTKDGKIQGAPEWVKTDKDVKKLRKLLRQLLREGISGRFWYEDSGREVLALVGGNIEEAARFIQLLAIYSANTRVDVNTTAAIKAWNMYKRGVSEDDFHVATSDQDTKAKNVLYRDDKWEGRKTGSFYVNLMFEILGDNPELAKTLEIDTDKLRATIDLWMYRAFGYVNESGGDDHKYGEYTFAESSIIKLAAELNRTRRLGDPIWTPHQVQAAIWTAMKTRYENETVKEKTNALGVKQGLITYKDGKPVYPRDGSQAQKAHYANWRKFALAIPDSDSVRAEAELTGVSFAEYIKRMTQHVTLEVIPSSKLNEDINGASEATKRAFTERALGEIILDKDGNDQIAQLLGVPLSRTMTSDGAYDGGLNPNIITSLVPDKVREFDSNGNPKTTLAFNYDTARAYARIIQYIFKQDGVPWFTPNFVPLSKSATDKQRFRVVTGPKEKRRTVKVFDTLQEANKFLSKKNNDAYYVIGGDNAQAVVLTFSDDLTSQKLVNLLKLLETKFGKSAGFTRMSNREVAIVNFRDDETKVPSLDDEVFFNALTDIKEDLHSLGVKDVDQFYAKGEYGYVHNWKEDNTGSAILDSDILRGRPDIQERVRVWRDLFEQLLEEYSGDSLRDKERAYVDRGTIRGSVTKTSERDIGPDAERETGEVKTQYPFKVEPDGSVRLFHWSNISGLTTLDPTMHGTGISGAEAKRKANDPYNYVNRLYFGVNEGGYVKEARLGSSKYEVSVPLDKLYDMAGDTSKYLEKAYEKVGPYAHDDAATLFEKMVKEAGYLGMWKDVGYKKHSVVAMLFTPTEAKSIAYSDQSNDAPNEGYRIAGEESDSTFKAPPVTLRAIKRAVPGAKVSITKDGLVRIQFKNGFVVNVNLSAKSIKIDQDVMKRDYGREATAGDIAVGRNYVTVDGEAFIDIVSGMTDMRTFHHELYEVARRMALSGQQLDILDKAFKGNKEAEAEAYAEFMVKRIANQSKLVNSLFQKISDFFADIRAKMFGQNSDDIFRQIGDSKVTMDANVDATGISPEYRIVGMGGQKFSSPAEVTMVTPADKQVAKQKVANLQYVPAPQTTWKTDSGRNKKEQAAWHALTDGLESVVEKREPRMTLKERIVHVKDWIVDNWIDNLSIIQRTADEKLYRHARGKVDGISSRAEKLIKFGDKKRGVEGLTQIFKGMSDEEFKGFLHYAEYKNIIDIINNSEEAMRFISKAYDEIASEKARLKELRSTKPLDADDAKQLARGIRGTVRYIEQLQKDIDHSLEYVREVRGKADQYLTTVMKMEKLYPDWVERQQKLTKYTNNLLRINRDSGMISANLYRFLTETRPNYLPALRDFSDEEGKVGLDSFIETRGFVNLKSPLRRMHGSKRDIVNPIDEIIANTFRTMSLEAKQSVATSFIDFYESRKDGDEYLWRTKPDKAIEEGHFMFFVRRDGEKHYYATDSPALYEALTLRSTSKINLGSVGKPAELITKMLRQATTRAVRFIIRNPERDNFQAAIYGEGFIPFVTAFRGGIQVVGGGEWFERFLEAGGAQGISTVDSDRLADMKAEILGKKFFRSKNPLKNIWNLLGRMAEVTELSTRVGQFKKAIELGYTDEEAAYIARDLMNFGIGGSDAKQMNRYIPFLTASIQDMNRFYRGHSKKNIAKTVRRAMMYITIPTLALWFWNNGDDDRKEYWDKLATWEKNAFWWIILNKDTAIPVAKPFLLGLVYGSLPERFMDYWLNNDRRAVEDFGKTLLAQTMPGYMPLALQLVMELGLNKSFFYGREIVPANEQKLEGKLQYGPYTAEWAKTLGSISGISPRKLEYAVFGVTGSLGKEISAVVDDVWRSVSGTTRPDKYITEYIPGSTAWISHGRNHMGPLYAWNLAFPALEEAYRSAKKVYEVDGADSLSDRQRLLLTYEGDVKAILKLNTAKDGIWKLQGLKNKVVVDKNMTAEQKRKAVDEINARIILLAQVGLKKLDFFQDAIDSMEDKMEARR